MSKETAEIEIVLSNGKKAGDTINELTGTAVKLNREIKNLKPGSEEFVAKTAEYQKVQGRLNDVRDSVKGTTSAQKQLTQEFGGMIPFNAEFQKFKGTFSNLTGGLKSAATGSNILKLAMAAIPIFLLITGITALVQWFKRTDDGATMLDGVMRAWGATMDVILDRLFNIGKTMKDLFSNPMQFFKNIGSDIKEAAQEGYELAYLFDELDQKRRDMELAAAENEKTITNLMLQSKNLALSEEERLALLDDASEKERANFQAKMDYSNQMLAAIQREYDLMVQAGTDTDEMRDKLNAARIDQIKLEEESMNLQEKIVNRRGQLTEKQDADREAAAKKQEAEAQKRAAQQQKRDQQQAKIREEIAKNELAAKRALEDLKIELIADSFTRENEKLMLQTERKIEALVGSEEQITEQKLLLEQHRDAKLDEYKLAREEELKTKEFEKKEAELELLAIEDEEEKLRLQTAFDAYLLTQDQYDDAIFNQERAALERKLAIIKQKNGEESAEYQRANLEILALDKDYHDQKIANAQAAADLKKQIEAASYQAAASFMSLGADLLSQDERSRKKHAATIKAFKIAEVQINLVSEIQKIWESNSRYGAPVGPALSVAQSAIALVRAGLAIGNISKQKFALGGVVRGPSHAGGGIDLINTQTGQVVGNMEGNEPILTKGVGKDPYLRSVVNYVNMKAGGRRIYAEGGIPNLPSPMNPLTSSSTSSFSETQNSTERQQETIIASGSQNNEQLLAEFRSLSMAISTWATTLKVVNDPRETFNEQANIKSVENDASI